MQIILKLCPCLPACILRYTWACWPGVELIAKLNLFSVSTVCRLTLIQKTWYLCRRFSNSLPCDAELHCAIQTGSTGEGTSFSSMSSWCCYIPCNIEMPMIFFPCCFNWIMLPLRLYQEPISSSALQCIRFPILMALTVFLPSSFQSLKHICPSPKSVWSKRLCLHWDLLIWEGTSLLQVQPPKVIIKYDCLLPNNTSLLSDVPHLVYKYLRKKYSNCAAQI